MDQRERLKNAGYSILFFRKGPERPRLFYHDGVTFEDIVNPLFHLRAFFEEIDFDLELLVYDVCDTIHPRIEKKPVELLCHIGENLHSFVKGDPFRMRQVLTNLMGNAAKFTESGEIEISIDIDKEESERVKFHTRIRDTGIGIPKVMLNTIFDTFQQADTSTTRMYGGSGLGLAICRNISHLLDGDVWVESETGKGSTFHFTGWLERAEGKTPKRFATTSLQGKKALVVDDNQTNLHLLTRMLTLADMRIVTLVNPEEVIPTLKKALEAEDPFDIFILDLYMPGLSGYDLAKRIREPEQQFPFIPMVALSSSIERDAKKCKEAGFDGFLTKPIHRKKLFRLMERMLGERDGPEEEEQDTTERITTPFSILEDMKHSVRILLAEDNVVNQKLAERMLTTAGYSVEVVNTGKEAIERFTATPEEYDLILMDVQMPIMDGMDATRAIRQNGFHAIPIIAMTAGAMKGDKEKCLESGMNDYIPKPIERKFVFEIIEKWVYPNVSQ